MRIAFVSTMYGWPWGGSEVLWSEAADRALKRGHQVMAVTSGCPTQPEPLARLAAAGMIARTVTSSRGHSRGLAARAVRKLTRLVAPALLPVWREALAWRPDFVCVSQGSAYDCGVRGDIADFLRRYGGGYGVVCQHNFEHQYLFRESDRERVAAIYSRARWVAFVADGNRRKAEQELGARIPNAVIVQNPVNLTERTAVPWPGDGPARLACVARLEAAAKGQDALFTALGGEAGRGRDWSLRLYGAGPDREYLDRVARMNGLGGRAEFAGHVADIRRLWADNHLLVMPSRSEGTPLSLVEAMLCGRPAVVTDVGGNAEWVSEPDTGFVAEAATPRSLGAALERAWVARGQWAEIGRRASAAAGARADPDAGLSLLERIEQSASDGGHAGNPRVR